MHLSTQPRFWLLYVALSLPATLFVSQWNGSGMWTQHYDVGWPLVAMDMTIFATAKEGEIFFQLEWPNLPLVGALWIGVAGLLWSIRRWAARRSDWSGAATQAILAGGYALLLFFFCYGVVGAAWTRWVSSPRQTSALLDVFYYSRRLLLWFYALGFFGAGCLLFLDARTRPRRQGLFHLAAGVCLSLVFWRLLPPRIHEQTEMLNEAITYFQHSVHATARR